MPVTIVFPMHDGTVGNTFLAYGECDTVGAAAVKGSMSFGGRVWNGVMISPPPYWVIQFTDLPTVNGCLLVVTDDKGCRDEQMRIKVVPNE